MMENMKKSSPKKKAATSTDLPLQEEKAVVPVAKREKPLKPSYIVGIGASAGGLDALQTFFDHVPSDSGMAFVVIQHLSPDYKSLMVELLSKHTKMEVLRVEDGDHIRPDCVYLIPPMKNMAVLNGKLYLSEQPQRHTLNLPIDVFFRSLAEDRGEKAACIILSGTGSDGTRGVRAIKGEGGIVFVQDEGSAQFDGMPKSAIATGLADFILPPAEMPEQLLRFISHPLISANKKPEETIEKDEDSFTRLFRLLHTKVNIDFTFYKPATVVRRVERRLGIVHAKNMDEYLGFIHKNPNEIQALFKDLLIGVTKFFRDTKAYETLNEEVLPSIFKAAMEREDRSVRVWVSACSTGEEAYSIALLMQDYIEKNKIPCQFKVFATDIDRDAIDFAGAGLYTDSIVADVDMELLSRYFEKKATGYQVRRSLRESVVFALQNLIKDPPFTKVDLISCRNFLIYLQPIMQKKVLAIFNYALNANGHLFLGSSETIGELGDSFDPTDLKNRIYRHKGKGALPLKDDMMLTHTKNMGTFSSYQVAMPPEVSSPSRNFEQREKYYHELIRKAVPTMFVVSENRELLQSFGSTRKYLRVPDGNFNLDILAMLPRELSLVLSSAIHRVRKEKTPATYAGIRMKDGDGTSMVTLKVDTTIDPLRQAMVFVITVTEDDPLLKVQVSENMSSHVQNGIHEQMIKDLDHELQFTRENLQATIEELQTANEELQATNEELLAANEELQSTNEELQSVNEELNTVNAEYQAKNIELTEVNNDMRNLIESTDIGTLFLSRDLHIRKFTPSMTRAVNLLEQDIGRPFRDLSIPLLGDEVLSDFDIVARTLQPVERQVRTESEIYLLRILPFYNEKRKFDGLVITLITITRQVKAEQAFMLQYKMMKRVLENTPSIIVMVNGEGMIHFANNQAMVELEIDGNSLDKLNIDSPKFQFTSMDGTLVSIHDELLQRVVKEGRQVDNFILCLQLKGKEVDEEVIYKVTATPTLDEQQDTDGAVLKFDRVAQRNMSKKPKKTGKEGRHEK